MNSIFNYDILTIIGTTFQMTIISSAISLLIGTILGLLLQRTNFPGKKIIVRINRTLMGVPPVVIGLVVYLLFMRKGFFGFLDILFTVPVMIIAQVLIITPIVCGMIYSASQRVADKIRTFGITMGANKRQLFLLLIRELSNEIYFVGVTGFGRAISEVGAVMIVGGNIRGQTRVMTTAIASLGNRGVYHEAIYLGIILLIISLLL